jgi:hypothetical protein
MTPDEKLGERLARDEARLAFDEARIDAEQEAIHENAIVANTDLALIVVLAIAVAALVVGVIALRRDVSALDRPAPDNSVSTEALQDLSVTVDKLANSSVIRASIVDGAVGSRQVAGNALTGADIKESTLATVPSARHATEAARLDGQSAASFVAGVKNVSSATVLNAQMTKGPLVARCPAGTHVVSGGAAVVGRTTGVSLVSSIPEGDAAWTATARARTANQSWRLTVTAICATGGR